MNASLYLIFFALIPPALAIVLTFAFWDYLRKKSDYIILGLFISSLCISALLVSLSAYKNETTDFRNSYLLSFASSLTEDVIFFSIIGVVLFILQRRDFFKDKGLEDRINFLFNQKNLTNYERSYLSKKLASCTTDFKKNYVHLDIKSIDKQNNMIEIDVYRVFSMGNYLKDMNAKHLLDVYLEADKEPKLKVALEIHPVFKTAFSKKDYENHRREERVPLGRPKDLTPSASLASGEKFQPGEVEIEIEPDQIVECSYRWNGWQPLDKGVIQSEPFDIDSTQSSYDSTQMVDSNKRKIPPPSEKRRLTKRKESYDIAVRRHWDDMIVSLSNDTDHTARIQISLGEAVKELDILPGMPAPKLWRTRNVKPDQKIIMEFLAFAPYKP